MKNKFKLSGIILILFVLIKGTYAQIEQTTEIKDYVNLLKSFKSAETFNRAENISIDELKHFARTLYLAQESNAKLTMVNYIETAKLHDSLSVLKYKHNLNVPEFFISPGQVQSSILKKIGETISPLVERIVANDYIIKAKIISYYDFNYFSESVNRHHIFQGIKSIVLEKIKGDFNYQPGDTIEFYYIPEQRPTNYNFEVGETTLLTLSIIGLKGESLILDCYDCLERKHDNYGRYPILDGVLTDKHNEFGFGTKVQWEVFKQHLIYQINTIKSW